MMHSDVGMMLDGCWAAEMMHGDVNVYARCEPEWVVPALASSLHLLHHLPV
jgi:hypothetical protein